MNCRFTLVFRLYAEWTGLNRTDHFATTFCPFRIKHRKIHFQKIWYCYDMGYDMLPDWNSATMFVILWRLKVYLNVKCKKIAKKSPILMTTIFFSRFPFYYEVKILLLIWLISPVSRGSLGSSIIYRKFVHPNLMKKEDEIDRWMQRLRMQVCSHISFIKKGAYF